MTYNMTYCNPNFKENNSLILRRIKSMTCNMKYCNPNFKENNSLILKFSNRKPARLKDRLELRWIEKNLATEI